jgi:hypothetical protein
VIAEKATDVMRRDLHLQEQPPEQRRKNLDAQKVVRSARDAHPEYSLPFVRTCFVRSSRGREFLRCPARRWLREASRLNFVRRGGSVKFNPGAIKSAPSLKRVAFLELRGDRAYLPSVESGARLLEMQLVVLPVSDAVDMKVAIERFAAEPNGGLLATPAVLPIGPFDVIRLAEQYRLPAICGRIPILQMAG